MGITLEEYFQTVYIPQHELKPATVSHCLCAIRSLSRWHGSEVTLTMLTDDFVTSWINASIAAEVARKTIKGYRGNILTLWRFAWSHGHVSTPIRFIKKVKLPKRIPSAWTLKEFIAILNSARREPGDIGRRPAADFFVALLLTLYDTGGRITPVMHTRTTDVNLQAKTLVFRAEHQKTNRDEAFSLSDQTVEALKKIWSPSRELLFGDWPFDWTQHDWGGLVRRYRTILHRAKLPATKADLFHKVRRTTATQLAITLGSIVEAAAYLGHSSHLLTEVAYIDATQFRRKTPADVLPRPENDTEGGES